MTSPEVAPAVNCGDPNCMLCPPGTLITHEERRLRAQLLDEHIAEKGYRPLPPVAPVPLKAGDLAYVRSRIARIAAFVEDDTRAGVVLDRELVLLLNRHLRSLP